MRPVIKEMKHPVRSKKVTTGACALKADRISSSADPNTAGKDSKKENLAASSLDIPEIIPEVMVDPDLDIPGITAKA
jgi:hypothetical protein